MDYRFQCLLVQLLGKDFIARYRRECPSEWLEMRLNFEQKKKSVKPNDKSALIRLPLNWGIAGKYQEITGKNIQQVIQSTSMQGVGFHNGAITLNSLIIKRLFDKVTAQIVDLVGKILKSQRATGIRMILLVGGFVLLFRMPSKELLVNILPLYVHQMPESLSSKELFCLDIHQIS